MNRRRPHTQQGGFSLIELVMVMTLMAIMAGVVTPVVGAVLDRERSSATMTEMDNFAQAVEGYFVDTGALPDSMADLVLDDGTTGWAGPYVTGAVNNAAASGTDFEIDGWGNAYRITITGDVWELESRGADRTFDTGDDLSTGLDVTTVRRTVSERRLETINLAVLNYNAYWLVNDPGTGRPVALSSTWSTARARLIATGYLSDATEYATDAWGDDFVRIGSSGPVDGFASSHFGAGL